MTTKKTKETAPVETANTQKKMRRVLVGKVVSNRMTDTIVVVTERLVQHPKYGKFVRRATKVYAQDKGNRCRIGDIVAVQECRPISKTKCWRLVEIQRSAKQDVALAVEGQP